MSGTIIPILPMTEFNFSFLNGGTSKTIVLAPAIDVINYRHVRLVVRVHEIDIATGVGSPKIEIGGYGTDPSPADPRDFALSSSDLSVIINTQSAGALVTASDTDTYPFLKLYAKGTQGTSNGTRLFAVLSADLIVSDSTAGGPPV